MYLPVCLLVQVICLNLVSCQNTGYKCENTCHSDVASRRLSQENASFGQSTAQHGNAVWSRLKKQIKSFDALRLTLKKALYVFRKIFNSGRAFKFPILRNAFQDRSSEQFQFDGQQTSENGAGRTFGIRRRMQLFLMLPISFKLGVIVTLLLVLTAMSLKGLIIGFLILLLILANTNTYSKLWGAPKHGELTDSNHRNVHIHVHTLSADDHHRPYVEQHATNWHGQSPGYVYQSNWHDSSPTTTLQL